MVWLVVDEVSKLGTRKVKVKQNDSAIFVLMGLSNQADVLNI